MEEKFRKTGIDVIGNVPWGTHICQFYQTKEDLMDILVPYFKAGLESNESCLWITSKPINEQDAEGAMREALPNFDLYSERGQIEIIPHTEWYLKYGVFESQRVLNGWIEKLNHALATGYDGLRLTGNKFWLEGNDWRKFADYEKKVNNLISQYRMIGICTYPIEECTATQVIDVVRNHQFALINSEGAWELIKSPELRRVEEALRESEDQLRLITDSLPVLISYVDSEQRYRFNNTAYEQWFGHPHKELYGKHIKEVLGEPGYQTIRQYVETALGGQEVTYECSVPYKDGGIRWIHAIYIPHFGKRGKVIGFFTLVSDITANKQAEEELKKYRMHLEEIVEERTAKLLQANEQLQREITDRKRAEGQLRSSQEQLRALSAHLQSVREEERAQIARKIHDELGQNLTALGISLNLVRTLMPREATDLIRFRLNDSLGLVEQMTERIRNVMSDLRPPVLDDYGLVAALRWYGDQFSSRTGIGVDVQGMEIIPRLTASVENALFRIAQEALTNVAKHAQATQVTVTVERGVRTLCLVIADDGIGFEPEHLAKFRGKQGWGLITIVERAEAVGGHCGIESHNGQGTRIVIEVPR
jgi:PAS domain S-box-containing protein